ncbi:MAG TPA: CBS domain-containing protein [Nitrososphaerales archaeon]|nr:CBS domain-containing protein [Nitrososphaerales archaeon]
MDLKKSLDEPVLSFTSKDFVKVPSEWSVTQAAKLMKVEESTEAVVTEKGDPVGIITERDILYKVVAGDLDPAETQVSKVMSSPIHTLDSSAKVSEAISEMTRLGIRRLVVTKGGKPLGVVSQKSVFSGNLQQQIPLPELSSPAMVVCPYCGAEFDDPEKLSKHIDRTHVGMGLLEGNSTKW